MNRRPTDVEYSGEDHVVDKFTCRSSVSVGVLNLLWDRLEGVEEQGEERRKNDETTKDIPRGPASDAGSNLVTESSHKGCHETVSKLPREHGQTSLARGEVDDELEVENKIEEPSRGTEVVAEVTHCISCHVPLLETISLDVRCINHGWSFIRDEWVLLQDLILHFSSERSRM